VAALTPYGAAACGYLRVQPKAAAVQYAPLPDPVTCVHDRASLCDRYDVDRLASFGVYPITSSAEEGFHPGWNSIPQMGIARQCAGGAVTRGVDPPGKQTNRGTIAPC